MMTVGRKCAQGAAQEPSESTFPADGHKAGIDVPCSAGCTEEGRLDNVELGGIQRAFSKGGEVCLYFP